MKKQFLLSLLASGARVILGFTFFWQISQALNLETLGDYLYLTAALGYFGTLIDYGFNLFVLNTASRSEVSVRPLFIRVIISKLLLTALSVAILAGLYVMAFAEQGPIVTVLFFLVWVLQSFSGLVIQFFKALGRFDDEFSSTLIASLLPVLAVMLLHANITLAVLACIMLAVRIAALIVQLAMFMRITSGQSWIHPDEATERLLPRALKDIGQNFKYAAFSVLGAAFLSIDLVVMRFMLGPEDVSVYGAAMKIIVAAILFFEVLNGIFTPRLSNLHSTGSERFYFETKRFYLIMIAASLSFSLIIFSLGPVLIASAFGPEFTASGALLRVLSIVLVLRVAEMTTGPLLTVYGLQSFRARAMIIVLPVHIGLNLILQSQFGIWGAVGALGFSYLLLLALNSLYLLRHRQVPRIALGS